MSSACGRYVITYNGEIYNFKDIASDLDAMGVSIKGGSDTAILLAACATWGTEKALSKCVGMFAFILWDREKRQCILARDRLGIKPLYWSQFGDLFLFGSELKALRSHPGWVGEIDTESLASYIRHAYVPAPNAIYKNVWKLEPGTFLTVPFSGPAEKTIYWNAKDKAKAGVLSVFKGSYEDAVSELEPLLARAVSDRMISDVPLGAFLSGGIDSSTVVALMQRQSGRPVQTFSIGFEDCSYNEAVHAAEVARHLDTDHTELFVTPQEARDLIPDLPKWYDEPFADSSQIPTLALSRLTREHVTVALSGDGGDEVFAGYNRYFWAKKLWRSFRPLPHPLRKCLKRLASIPHPAFINKLGNGIPGLPAQLGDKLHKIAAIIDQTDIDGVYRQLVSQWTNPELIMSSHSEKSSVLWDQSIADIRPDAIGRMQLLDMITYLPDDILTKVDRASMAFSLEARVPLIDHRVIEFAWRLPREYLLRNGKSKSVLRSVLSKFVPDTLIERPKMGFGVPLDAWLRGPLRPWAENLLDEVRLRQDGFFNTSNVRRAWADHLSGSRNMSYGLWTILMFQAWREYDQVVAS